MAKSPVSMIQEYCSRKKLTFPTYNYINSDSGFVCEVKLLDHNATGIGRSKPNAKHQAAENMLKLIWRTNLDIDSTDHSLPQLSEQTFDHKLAKPPVSVLQEYCSRKKLTFPTYNYINSNSGFVCEVKLLDHNATGIGRSKQDAKHQAAENMLKLIRRTNLDIDSTDHSLPQLSEQTFDHKLAKPPVSVLQEYCSRKKLTIPTYNCIYSDSGYICEVKLLDHNATGIGLSKQDAKHKAAENMLKLIRRTNLTANITDCDETADTSETADTDVDTVPTTDKIMPLQDIYVQHNQSLPQLSEQTFDHKLAKPPVSVLQEYCSRKKLAFSTCNYMNSHNAFVCEVKLLDHNATGIGRSEQDAKHKAAENMLKLIRRTDLTANITDCDETADTSATAFTDDDILPTTDKIPIIPSKIMQQSRASNVPGFTAVGQLASLPRHTNSENKKDAKQKCSEVNDGENAVPLLNTVRSDAEDRDSRKFKKYFEFIQSQKLETPRGVPLCDRHNYFANFPEELKEKAYAIIDNKAGSQFKTDKEKALAVLDALILKPIIQPAPTIDKEMLAVELDCDFEVSFIGREEQIWPQIIFYFDQMLRTVSRSTDIMYQLKLE